MIPHLAAPASEEEPLRAQSPKRSADGTFKGLRAQPLRGPSPDTASHARKMPRDTARTQTERPLRSTPKQAPVTYTPTQASTPKKNGSLTRGQRSAALLPTLSLARSLARACCTARAPRHTPARLRGYASLREDTRESNSGLRAQKQKRDPTRPHWCTSAQLHMIS